MTARMASLLEDAKHAGYEVKLDGTTTLIFKRLAGRRRSRLVGLVIYDDGTAFDLAPLASIAKGLRSYKDMRTVLKI